MLELLFFIFCVLSFVSIFFIFDSFLVFFKGIIHYIKATDEEKIKEAKYEIFASTILSLIIFSIFCITYLLTPVSESQTLGEISQSANKVITDFTFILKIMIAFTVPVFLSLGFYKAKKTNK